MHARYGTDGHRMDVDVNAFSLSWAPRSVIMHYDVSIKPDFNGPGGKDINVGGEKGTEILQRLQVNIRPELFPKPGGAYLTINSLVFGSHQEGSTAFDGKKNLYAFRPFKFTSERFEVPWDKEHTPGRKMKTVTIQIVLVRRVDISLLRKVLSGNEQGNPSAIGPGTDVASSLNMLQAFLQAAPKMYGCHIPLSYIPSSVPALIAVFSIVRRAKGNLHKGKSVYVQWSKGYQQTSDQKRIDERMRPLRLIDGFFHTWSITVRYYIDFKRCSWRHCGEFDKLRHFLRDVKVSIHIPGKASKSKGRRAIRNLIRDVGAHNFDRNGVPTTIRDYFLSTHGVRIPPQSIGVVIGNHEIFPISVCVVPEQLYKSKLLPDHVREVLSFVPKNPRERLQRIKAGWQNLEYDNSEFLKGADIAVRPEALTISGRILPSPQIMYGGTHGPYKLTLGKPGTWDVMRKTFWAPAKISFVLIFNLTGRRHGEEMKAFMSFLFKTLSERAVPKTSLILDDNGADPKSLIRREAEKHNAKPNGLLVLALLPENAAELYANVKRVGDIQLGVPTQCIRWSSKLIQNVKSNRVDQYLNNLALKINARCGGVNHVPSSIAMNYLAEMPTMVIGADVTHPSPGSTAPSFASLVSSRDPQCSIYSAQMKIQPFRREIIESIDDMMTKAIKIFRMNSDDTKYPHFKLRRIFFFRDGVSEGEFETVRELELNALKRLLEKFYGRDRPRITFIVVGKRHHFRFFPKSGGTADASGNCPSGFVVDRGIEHPVYSDFYLQSQPGLKGTSIPAHYTVIEDENLGGNGDRVRSNYPRQSTLVCQRAKFHFQPRFSNQLDGFSDAATDDTPESLTQDFRNLHQNLDMTMHFM
ncbi:Piwi domain-containing protein [Lentinula edodes]|nr:Piwi domain-containing protein [Lentinula edodes]